MSWTPKMSSRIFNWQHSQLVADTHTHTRTSNKLAPASVELRVLHKSFQVHFMKNNSAPFYLNKNPEISPCLWWHVEMWWPGGVKGYYPDRGGTVKRHKLHWDVHLCLINAEFKNCWLHPLQRRADGSSFNWGWGKKEGKKKQLSRADGSRV